jgi:site-specific recombinase XerD
MTAAALAPSKPTVDLEQVLLPAKPTKNDRCRIKRFAEWMQTEAREWTEVDLAAWRDAMLEEGLAEGTVTGYLSSVRTRYRDILRKGQTRDFLYHKAVVELQRLGQEDSPANRKAYVDEVKERLENALDPAEAPVKTETKQDQVEEDHLRLTTAQANALIAAPGLDSLTALRDTAMIALVLCTGIREGELVNLEVRDLRRHAGNELCLHVRHGKGDKTRVVPYGENSWALALVEKWLDVAGITEGPVFRSFWRGGRKIRPGKMTTRAVQLILANYPIAIDGKPTIVRPHDLRRTYARRMYEAGMDLVAIQQNLGHASLQTTLGYIGQLDMDQRRAPSVYSFDLGALSAFTV